MTRHSATSTSCCAASRAWSARSSSTSGLVLYSQQADFLDVAYRLDPDRLPALAPELDLEAVEASLRTLADVCAGGQRRGSR